MSLKRLFLAVPKRRGHTVPPRATQGSSRVIQEVEGTEGKCRQEAFTGVSLGKDGGGSVGRLSSFRIGWSK